jgi:hypothetical protein
MHAIVADKDDALHALHIERCSLAMQLMQVYNYQYILPICRQMAWRKQLPASLCGCMCFPPCAVAGQLRVAFSSLRQAIFDNKFW